MRKLYSVESASFCAEPPLKSPATLTRGASAAFRLRLKSCSPTTENWLMSEGGERGIGVHHDVVFAVLVVVAGGGEGLAADALVLPGPILDSCTARRRSGLAAELVGGADAELGVAGGRGHVGLVEAGGIGGRGQQGGIDDRVEIFLGAIEGDEEAAFGGEEDGAGEVAFVDAALLEGLGGGERVLRVHGGIAEVEIELAVVVVGGGFGDDLHLAAAGPVVLRGVGILVDADFLHGGCGDGGAIGLDAVDDEAGAAGGGGAVVKERATWRSGSRCRRWAGP